MFPVQGRNKLGHTSWERTICGLSQSGSNSFGIWNSKTCRVVEREFIVFVETPPHWLPPFRRLSPLQVLEARSSAFGDNSVDDNYTSREDMVQTVRDYTNSLDVDVNGPAELLTVQASPGCFRLGKSHRINHRHLLHLYLRLRQKRHPHPRLHRQHCQQPPRAQTATPWSPGFTHAVARSHIRSPVATDYRATRNNLVAVPGLFLKDTLKQVHKQGCHANLDMAEPTQRRVRHTPTSRLFRKETFRQRR